MTVINKDNPTEKADRSPGAEPDCLSKPSSPHDQVSTAGKGYIASLDGVRGIAILMVLLVHTTLTTGGWVGVDVFFVLSGYLITRLLLKEVRTTGRIDFKNFYMRRVLRLAPALLTCMAALLAFSLLTNYQLRQTIKDIAATLLYVSNWTHAFGKPTPVMLGQTWSLSVEEQFYFLWPLLVFCLYRLFGNFKRCGAFCAFCAIVVVLYRTWAYRRGASPMFLYCALHTHCDTLLLGSVMAFIEPYVRPRRVIAWIGWVAFVILCIYATFGPSFGDRTDLRMDFSSAFSALIIFPLLVYPAGTQATLFSWRPLAWIGRISYGLYIYHWPIMHYLLDHQWNPLAVLAVAVPATFVCATLSYYLVEKPILRLKDRFAPRRLIPTSS